MIDLWVVQAASSAILFSISGVMFKANSLLKISPHPFFFSLYISGAFVLLFSALSGDFKNSVYGVVLGGAVVGVGLTMGNYFLSKSLLHGPISLSAPIINANILVLVFLAVIFYGEKIGITEGILSLIIIISLLILSIDPNEDKTIKTNSWYFLVILASLLLGVRNGGLKVTGEAGFDGGSVLFFAYLISSFIVLILGWNNGLKSFVAGKTPKAILFGTVAGIFSASGMLLYSYALEAGPAAIVIPVFSSYNAFLILWGFWFFKEKLTQIQMLSVFLVVVSMTLLSVAI